MKEFLTDISKRLLLFFLIGLLVVAIVFGCIYALSNRRIYPESGMWYCDELQITINFDYNGISKAIIDGKETDCVACYHDDSKNITIEYVYTGVARNDRIIFPGEFVSLKNNELVLTHRDTQVNYTFFKLE